MHATRVPVRTYDGRDIPSSGDVAARDEESRRARGTVRGALDGIPPVPYALVEQVSWAGETPVKSTRDRSGYPLMGRGLERLLTTGEPEPGPRRLYLRVEEIVSLLGISKSTVLKHIEQGRLRSNRPTDHHRVPVSSFYSFLEHAGYDEEQRSGFFPLVQELLER